MVAVCVRTLATYRVSRAILSRCGISLEGKRRAWKGWLAPRFQKLREPENKRSFLSFFLFFLNALTARKIVLFSGENSLSRRVRTFWNDPYTRTYRRVCPRVGAGNQERVKQLFSLGFSSSSVRARERTNAYALSFRFPELATASLSFLRKSWSRVFTNSCQTIVFVIGEGWEI